MPRKNIQDTKFAKLYYSVDKPTAYTGNANALAVAAGSTLPRAKQWLRSQKAYTKYKPARKHFPRNKVFVQGVNEQLDIDLVSVIPLAENNDGYKYWLTAVDVLSKFASIVPIRSKSGPDVARALKIILRNVKPRQVRSDLGREFFNRHVQKVLKDMNVRHFGTYNADVKASIVERFHRTIRAKLWRLFEKTNSTRYVEALPQLLKGYNNTVHTSTGLRPSEVTPLNQHHAWQNLYPKLLKQREVWRNGKKRGIRPSILRVGDSVRLSKAKHVFQTGYVNSWTDEIFTIQKVIPPLRGVKDNYYRYKVQDNKGEVITGTFYQQELQLVTEEKHPPKSK